MDIQSIPVSKNNCGQKKKMTGFQTLTISTPISQVMDGHYTVVTSLFKKKRHIVDLVQCVSPRWLPLPPRTDEVLKEYVCFPFNPQVARY
jgi:hypothetical protein